MKKIFTKSFYIVSAIILFLAAAIPVRAQFATSKIANNSGASAMTKDAAGNIYVVENPSRGSTAIVVEYAAGTNAPTTIYNGTLITTANHANDNATGIAVASNGDVYVTTDDTNNGQVIKLTKSTNYSGSVFLQGDGATNGFYSAVAFDSSNNLYTVEFDGSGNGGLGSYAVVKYPAASTTGTKIYEGLEIAASNDRSTPYTLPTGLYVTAAGDVYVGDGFNATSQATRPSTGGGNIIKLPAGNYGNPVTIATNAFCSALTLDPSGDLYTIQQAATGDFSIFKYTNNAGTLSAPASIYTQLGFSGDIEPDAIAFVTSAAIYAVNGANDDNTDGDFIEILGPPTTPATNVLFTADAPTTFTTSWTNGDGVNRAVFIATSATNGNAVPVNGIDYTANAKFGSGTQIGNTGWYCIYNGTGNTVNVTGLTAGTGYKVQVIEYNGASLNEQYLTTPGSGNPATETTISIDATLSSLAVDQGTLTPAFSSATISYTASVANSVTSFNLTATTNSTNATVSINNAAVTSGIANNYTLSVGQNTFTTVVTAQDGSTTKTYTLVVTRAQSPDNNLSALTLSAGTLNPVFASATTSYSATVPYTSSSIMVTPTVDDANATVTVNGTPVSTGTASSGISLGVGSNTITVEVTAQDATLKDYTIAVTRTAPATDATLNNLTVDAGTLNPTFASATNSYNLTVPNATTTLNVTPTVNDINATVTVNGAPATSGSAKAVALLAGPNTITVTVTAQDGTTTNSYTINEIGTGAMDASLKTISLSNGVGLSRTTGTSDINYKASVAAGTTSLMLTATASDPNAVITINGVQTPSGSPSAAINLGRSNPTVVNLVSTAQDGTNSHSYSVSIYTNGSSNASLSNLAINSGTALTLSTGTTNPTYTTSVPANLTSVIFTPTAQDAGATISVAGHPVTSGSGSPALPLNATGQTSVNILVTAADGVTTNTYTVLINKVASANASLATLSLSSGSSLTATSNLTYTTSVAAGTPSLTVTPTAQDGGATLLVNGSPVASGHASQLITLNNGAPTNINIQVTAANGTTVNIYTVTVNMAGSSNASLTTLSLSTGSKLTATTGASNVNYTTSVSNTTNSITVTPTAQDPNANILVNGTQVTSGTPSAAIILNPNGSTLINVQVTAQDGTTVRTYSITVYQTGSSNASLKSLSVNTGALTLASSGQYDVNYTQNVNSNVSSISVRATAADATASITINGDAVANGVASNPINLAFGSNNIVVRVTAQDGVTVHTYGIFVTRGAPPITNLDAYSVNPDINSLQSQAVLVHAAVSPNGDGINDFLLIEGINSRPDNKITIINRNGGVVYEAKGYDNSSKMFDGHSSVNGSLQQPGTYLYVLDYTDAGVNKHLTGYIVLKY